MRDVLNCPNCGAPIQDDICPYCGSVFLDWATFDLKRPTFVKVKDHQGRILLMRLSTPSIRITIDSPEQTYFYADNSSIYCINKPADPKIEAEFNVIPYYSRVTGKDVLYTMINPEIVDLQSDFLKQLMKETKEI